MRIFRSKVFKRIVWSYILLLLIPTLVIGVVGSLRVGSIVYDQIQDGNVKAVEGVKQTVSSWMWDLGQVAARMGNMPSAKRMCTVVGNISFSADSVLSPGDVDVLRFELGNRARSLMAVKDMALVFRKGNIVIDSTGYYTKEDYFGSRYQFIGEFQNADDIHWQNPEARLYNNMRVKHYKQTSEILLYSQSISIPIASSASVLITIDREALRESMDFSQSAMFVVADEKGEFLLGNLGETGYDALKGLLPGDGGTRSGTALLDGTKYAYYGISDPDTGFLYTAFFDTNSITSRVSEVVCFSVWVALGTLLLGLCIAFVEAGRSYAPIAKIAGKLYINKDPGKINEYSSIEEALDGLKRENTQLSDKMANFLPVMKNNLLCHLLSPGGDRVLGNEELCSCGICFTEPCFRVAVLQMEIFSGDGDSSTGGFRALTVSAFLQYAMESALNSNGDVCYLVEKQDGAVALILNTKAHEPKYFEERFKQVFADLRRQLGSAAEVLVQAGFSDSHGDVKDLPAAHLEAMSACEYRNWAIESDFIWYADIRHKGGVRYPFTLGEEQRLINLMKTGERESCFQFVNGVLDQYFSQGRMKREDGLYIFNELLSACIKVMHERKGLEDHSISFYQLASYTKFHEMNDYVLESIKRVCDAVRESEEPRPDKLANSIIEWIDAHYENPAITLTYLSEEFHVSSSYISRLIKECLGVNFIEYLNKKRIEKAKELLKDDRVLVKDIALQVGYDCDKNFRRVFKKFEGITPGEYRNLR